MTEIYALLCPTTGDVRYIGKANNSQERLKSHIRAANDPRRNYTPVYRWIAKLRRSGLQPAMQVLAVAIGDDWQTLERQMIAQWRQEVDLLNIADGGNEPFCSPEVRKRSAMVMNAHPNTKRQRAINAEKFGNFARLDDMGVALRRAASHMGQNIKFMRDIGKPEKAERFAATLKKFQAHVKKDREQVFYRMLMNERMRKVMGVELA